MALKAEAVAKIATLLKITPEALGAALKDENEVDVELPDGISTFTETELDTLKKNEYKAGKEKGVEMAVKETKDELGLEFTGKSIKGLAEAAAKKALEDAKVAPDQKVAELQEKLTNAQKTIQDQSKQLQEKDTEVTTTKIHTEIYKHIPDLGEGGLSKDDVIFLMERNGIEPKLEDGKTVFYKDGKLMMNNLSEALPVADVVKTFVAEKKLVAEGGEQIIEGRGHKNGKVTLKPTKLSELKEQFTKDGKSLLGEEFQKAYSQAVADNPEFDLQN